MSFIFGIGILLVSSPTKDCAAALDAIRAIEERSGLSLDQIHGDPGNLEAGSYREFATDAERKALVSRLKRLKNDLESGRASVQVLNPQNMDGYRSGASQFELLAMALAEHYRKHQPTGYLLSAGVGAGLVAILWPFEINRMLNNSFGLQGLVLGTSAYVTAAIGPTLAFEYFIKPENLSKFIKQDRLQRRLENWWNRGKDYSGNWLVLSRRSMQKDIDYLFYFDDRSDDPQPILFRVERARQTPAWSRWAEKLKPVLTYPVSEPLVRVAQRGAQRVERITASQWARITGSLSSIVSSEPSSSLGDVLKHFPKENKQAVILIKRDKNTFWLARPSPNTLEISIEEISIEEIRMRTSAAGELMIVIEFQKNPWNETADSDFNVRFVGNAFMHLHMDSPASLVELPTSESPTATITWQDIWTMAKEGRNLRGFDPEALSPVR